MVPPRVLVEFVAELHGKHAGLYLHQQGLDTTTPAGKALFQMMGIFAEFDRSMIVETVKLGLARAQDQGEKAWTPATKEAKVLALGAEGKGILKIAKEIGIVVGTVKRVVDGVIAIAPNALVLAKQ